MPAVPLRIKAQHFDVGFIRPENLIFHYLGSLSGVFSKLHADSCVLLRSGHSAIKP